MTGQVPDVICLGRSSFDLNGERADSWFAGEIEEAATVALIADNQRRVIALCKNRGR